MGKRPSIPSIVQPAGLFDAAKSVRQKRIECISKARTLMSWLPWIPGALVLGAVGVSLGDDLLYRYEGDAIPHDPSEGWIIADAREVLF